MNIRLRRFYIYVVIVALALLLNGSGFAASAAADCTAPECVYLPLVSNPMPVRVFETKRHNSRMSTLRVIGEVITTSDRPVYEVTVEVRVYDHSGRLLGSSPGITALAATLPDQLNPFDVTTNVDDDGSIGSYEVVITQWSLESEQVYRPATAVITGMEYIYSGTWVYAEARNDESQTLADVYEVMWSLNQNDYSPVSAQPIAACLAPGEMVAFTRFIRGTWGGGDAPIQVAAQGVLSPCTP